MSDNIKTKAISVFEEFKNTHSDIVAVLDGIHVDKGHVMVSVGVDPSQGSKLEDYRQSLEASLSDLEDIKSATVVLTAETKSDAAGKKISDQDMLARPIAPQVKNIIAVASGKGGVGKSTVAANLALAFADQGYKTGLVDADIYGPSQHRMMGVSDRIEGSHDRTLTPLEAHGIKFISIGSMIEEDRPVIWRGPMVQTAVLQFFRDVIWGDMDVLVVDLPPGTGDAHMTLAQKIPLTGAVVVSTPQDIALIDARKAVGMFKKMDVPILGIIENMSQHICSNCGHSEDIFGHEGARTEAEKQGIPFLGALALDRDIRMAGDEGTPLYKRAPEHPVSQMFKGIAKDILTTEKAA